MSQIIAVTAGKGGTGKSTTSANVATALAALGKKTLVVELDFGLRCLDIMLGIKDKVKHDIGEYLEGKIDILTATTKVDRVDNLYLVCATRNPFIDINPEKIMEVCEEMRKHFDYIIMDTAGIGSSVFSVIKAAGAYPDGNHPGYRMRPRRCDTFRLPVCEELHEPASGHQ